VTKHGKPVAKVVAIRSSQRRKRDILGYMKGTGRIVGDIESPASDPRDWEVLRS
jgi:antitoxin (DNA-binding transcriptional repressor) of toxin-antitoxin stability system